ncbi:MAG: helix-turn-helix domain-containing protein [Solirubrobacteraceae bacterium]
MISVPQAAQRTGMNPETIRRWIRAGRLRSTRVGTQHMIDEADLAAVATPPGGVELPTRWQRFDSGRPLPDVAAALERSRRGR